MAATGFVREPKKAMRIALVQQKSKGIGKVILTARTTCHAKSGGVAVQNL